MLGHVLPLNEQVRSVSLIRRAMRIYVAYQVELCVALQGIVRIYSMNPIGAFRRQATASRAVIKACKASLLHIEEIGSFAH